MIGTRCPTICGEGIRPWPPQPGGRYCLTTDESTDVADEPASYCAQAAVSLLELESCRVTPAVQSFVAPATLPQSTRGSCGAPWKAAVATRWVTLVDDHRPKMLRIVKLGVVRTALDGEPPGVNVLVLLSHLPTRTSLALREASWPSTVSCGANWVAAATASPPRASAVAPASAVASATTCASRRTNTCRPTSTARAATEKSTRLMMPV